MQKITKKILILTLAILLCLIPQSRAFAAPPLEQTTSERIAGWIDAIWARKLQEYDVSDLQQLIWRFADEPEIDNSWFIISLVQRYPGKYDLSEYRQSFEKYVSELTSGSATFRLKAALVLQAIGGNKDLINRLTEEGIGKLGIMSYVYGLHALQNGAECSAYSKADVINTLLDMQFPDGGWAVMGEIGDVDVTAMTIQALAPECEHDQKVRTACEKGIELLAKRQREDGTFISYGNTNSESTAQVLLALAYMGVDWTTDERFIKQNDGVQTTVETVLYSFSYGDGTFEHVKGTGSNKSATIQALYALTGCEMELNGEGHFYVFREFSEPAVPRPDSDRKPDGTAAEAAGIRKWLYCGIGAAAFIACIILFLLKKRSYKSYVFVLIIAALAAAGVTFINIEKPSDYYGKTDQISDPIKTTLSIRCDTVAGQKDHVPADGIILNETEVIINNGQTAYDQIVSAVRERSIHIETRSDGYIEGIANIYEFDFGDLSGWMYKVNGEFADVGCGGYTLSEGDKVEWLYTTNLGKDLEDGYHGD